MTKKDAFILDVVSGIDEDIIAKNLSKRYELMSGGNKRKRSMWIPMLAAAASFFILLSSLFIFLKYLGAPVYLGMTVKNESITLDSTTAEATFSKPTALDSDSRASSPMYLAYTAEGSTDPASEENVSDNYYAMPGDDIYIYVHIDNPDGFEILSFTLNGVKYSSHMFEDGSDLETLILKCNVGDEVGVKQYTIDAIKYVDGNAIRNLRMEGEQTVDVIVGSAVSSLNFDINTVYGSTVLTPILGDGMDSLPEILSIDVYHGTDKIMECDPRNLTINGLPLNARLLLVVTYKSGDSTEVFRCVFDTPRVSEGLDVSLEGYVVGIGSCKDTTLYLDKPIGVGAFSGNEQIRSVYLGEGAAVINDNAFGGCKNLESIFVSEDVREISGSAFASCPALARIIVDDDNEIYRSENNCLIEDETDALILGCKTSRISTTVKSIAQGAFLGCTELTDITIPKSVTSIGAHAFEGCSALASITIHDGVTDIGDSAFDGCVSLTDITLPNSVITMGESVFYGCESLVSVRLSGGISTIERSAFYDCKSLSEITVPEGVTAIGGSAFFGCTALTRISLPESLRAISASAFYGCEGLTSVALPMGVESIGASAFYKCTSLTVLTLPDTLEYIGDSAFFGCTALRSVIIPSSVKTIDRSAFCVCEKLTSVTISSGVEVIDSYAFYFCKSLTAITFEGTKEQWNAIQRAPDWNLWAAAAEVQCSDGVITIS